eukprot:2531092-Lingulodinium_polyedra.AAC.1
MQLLVCAFSTQLLHCRQQQPAATNSSQQQPAANSQLFVAGSGKGLYRNVLGQLANVKGECVDEYG